MNKVKNFGKPLNRLNNTELRIYRSKGIIVRDELKQGNKTGRFVLFVGSKNIVTFAGNDKCVNGEQPISKLTSIVEGIANKKYNYRKYWENV